MRFVDYLKTFALTVLNGFFVWLIVWGGAYYFCAFLKLSPWLLIFVPTVFTMACIGCVVTLFGVTVESTQNKKETEKREAVLKTREDFVTSREKDVDVALREIWDMERDFAKLIASEKINNPWMAQQFADFEYTRDLKTASCLASKKHPAVGAAEQVKNIAGEKRELQILCKKYEYERQCLFTVIPWLEDFIDISPVDAAKTKAISDEIEDYGKYKDWLSPQEYSELPTAEKYQLALDRYRKKPKSDWEAGVLYERFIGYGCEKNGYAVKYFGATMKLEDMGRDIVATRDDEVLIIQCKRRRADKQIHENVVFQTYGTAMMYQMENEKLKVKAVICTTSELSETAKKSADYLGVVRMENVALSEYPLIKCNVTKTGEKIYHLPFDQQYDRIQMRGKSGAMYAETVAEAEDCGFRRAHKWIPENS